MPFRLPWEGSAGKEKTKKKGVEEGGNMAVEIVHMETPGSLVRTIFDEGGATVHQSPFAPNVGGRRSYGSSYGGAGAGAGGGGWRGGAGVYDQQPKTPNGSSSKKGKRAELESERRAAPEKDLTLFAMRLAVLEKVASNVGTLGFIWATVVLLGGFAITLKEVDFWFVTVILVIEGARIFSRSHELEWQHQDAGTQPGNPFSRAYRRGSDALFKSQWRVRSALSNLVSPTAGGLRNSALGSARGTPPQAPPAPSPQPRRLSAASAGGLRRTWSSSRVPLVPFLDWIFRAKHVSRLLYWMQLLAACLAIVLSVLRLRAHDFTRSNETDTTNNHNAALFIFYSLATFEAAVFLLERSYWQIQISFRKILVRVNERCGLSDEDLSTTRRFFYDVYSKCLNDSIFEGLKMDMIDYGLTWLQSDLLTDQLAGLRVLLTFSDSPKVDSDCSEETLRTIGNRQAAIERLLEMVTWKNEEEQDIRRYAAELLCKLVKYNRNCVRVAAISGSIEGVFSLLAEEDENEYYIRQGGSQPLPQRNQEIRVMGLRILKNLAKDPLNCAKIGTTRGLLSRLISFIDIDHTTLHNAQELDHRLPLVKKSLELLNFLAAATGSAGKMLREEIAKVVYTMSNLRRILEHSRSDVMVALALEMLSSLAMDDDLRETIGRTGGVIRSLVALFVKERVGFAGDERRQAKLQMKAGEALALLTMKNQANCLRVLRLKVKPGGGVTAAEEAPAGGAGAIAGSGSGPDVAPGALLALVDDWTMGYLALTILRSLCAYSGPGTHAARIASTCTRPALRLALERGGLAQEAALGLLAKTVPHLAQSDVDATLAQMSPATIARKLAGLLEHHHSPSTSLPRVRRYTVELAMALVDRHPGAFLPEFHALNFGNLLHRLADSASELENYATFSGANGVTPHALPMWQLVDQAIVKLQFHHLVSP